MPADDRAFATSLARYCARNPVGLERLTYDRAAKAVPYRSDKSEGPTAGTETADPLEFLARVLVHIPEKGHVTTRYYGWYANRPRGMRVKAAPVAMDGPPTIVRAPRLAPSEATRRWAALLQQIFKVDPLACPTCHSALRIVAFITQASVIDQILAHLRARPAAAAHTGARSPPIDAGPREPRGVTRPPHVGLRPDRPMSTAAPTPRDLAGTFGVRGDPIATPPRAPARPARPAPPDASRLERPARCASPAEGSPTPTRRRSRGQRPRRVLNDPRLSFLSRMDNR